MQQFNYLLNSVELVNLVFDWIMMVLLLTMEIWNERQLPSQNSDSSLISRKVTVWEPFMRWQKLEIVYKVCNSSDKMQK